MKTKDITVGEAYEVSFKFPKRHRRDHQFDEARLVRGVVVAVGGANGLVIDLADPRHDPTRSNGYAATYRENRMAPSQVKRTWADREAQIAAQEAKRAAADEAQRQRAIAEHEQFRAEWGETVDAIEATLAPFGARIVDAGLRYDMRNFDAGMIPAMRLHGDVAIAAWLVGTLPATPGGDALVDEIVNSALSGSSGSVALVPLVRNGTLAKTGTAHNMPFEGAEAISMLADLVADEAQVAKLAPLAEAA